ncbi:hypothetical protein PVAND_001144 [Polypedilum vanderplanki]|uniref:GSKIP domain-containing protein n=1 Tax=Polypedilum vanderplanki TaxID=319348 RepID=A0A9J6BNA6_POLVA|nr:hypothetical protein PVAND_001144 [Polypedilum vanderplanki]
MEDIIDWTQEANAVINDVKKHVKTIEISDKLISDGSNIFLNVTLLEGKTMTVLLDNNGFHIVSLEHNSIDEETSETTYETIYALLQAHSEQFINSFGNALVSALEKEVK